MTGRSDGRREVDGRELWCLIWIRRRWRPCTAKRRSRCTSLPGSPSPDASTSSGAWTPTSSRSSTPSRPRAQDEDVTRDQLHVYAVGYEELTGERAGRSDRGARPRRGRQDDPRGSRRAAARRRPRADPRCRRRPPRERPSASAGMGGAVQQV